MTVGVGGSTAEAELAAIKNMRGDVPPIGVEERLQRIARAQAIMREKGIDALYLDVSSSMTYFTGLKFRRTERMHSAVLPAKGEIVYISPAFEVEKLKTMTSFGEKIAVWEEDEDPTATVTETVRALGYPSGTILTFILGMNAYATPVLLGGPKFKMMGPLIYGQFQLNNWPFGASVAFILMTATLALTATANILVQRRFRR